MTKEQHPITPPPELVQEWYENTKANSFWIKDHQESFATRAAQWGADQELEACCEWVKSKQTYWAHDELRAARRPKPPSLKEQALIKLTQLVVDLDRAGMRQQASMLEGPIRRALEALPE
jgi:hypothetical protein